MKKATIFWPLLNCLQLRLIVVFVFVNFGFFAKRSDVVKAKEAADSTEVRQSSAAPFSCPLLWTSQRKCVCDDVALTASLTCRHLSASDVHALFHQHQPFLVPAGAVPLEDPLDVLQTLRVFDSELTDLSALPRMERLRVLNVSGNQLNRVMQLGEEEDGELPPALLDRFAGVKVLDLSKNRLMTISRNSFFFFPNLETLVLSENQLIAIDWEAFRLVRLKRLYLDKNNLHNVPEHAFRFSPSLEWLNISRNQLTLIQSSSFFAAQRLRHLDLSHNQIQRIEYDSFSPLFQLEHLDLAWNNLSAVPIDLRQFVALRTLNLSGNPLKKLSEGEFVHPMLQRLDVSNCPQLRLVESRALVQLPNLQFLQLSNNTQLAFISPTALRNNSLLFEMNVANCSLETLDFERLLARPIRLSLAGNPLRCACVARALGAAHVAAATAERIVDLSTTTCVAPSYASSRSRNASTQLMRVPALKATTLLGGDGAKECDAASVSAPLRPMGAELEARVGDFFALYCVPSVAEQGLRWTLPNGTRIDILPFQPESSSFSAGSGRSGYADYGSIAYSSTTSYEAEREGGRFGDEPRLSSSTENADERLGGDSLFQRHNFRLEPAVLPPSTFIVGHHGSRDSLTTLTTRRSDGRHPHQTTPPTFNNNRHRMPPRRLWPRVFATRESLRFEVLMTTDAGEYECQTLGADGPGLASRIRLRVRAPTIELRPVEIGSHYVALAWNDSLRVRSLERVYYQLRVQDTTTGHTGRVIQLSPLNPWHNYNVMRLRPDTNYTFCLVYSLKSASQSASSGQSDRAPRPAEIAGGYIVRWDPPPPGAVILQTCTLVRTAKPADLWTSLSPTAWAVIASIGGAFMLLLCLRGICLRFYIWHETKLRARMNQSISGQGFLVSSRSANNQRSSAHQNHQQNAAAGMMSQSTSMDTACYAAVATDHTGRKRQSIAIATVERDCSEQQLLRTTSGGGGSCRNGNDVLTSSFITAPRKPSLPLLNNAATVTKSMATKATANGGAPFCCQPSTSSNNALMMQQQQHRLSMTNGFYGCKPTMQALTTKERCCAKTNNGNSCHSRRSISMHETDGGAPNGDVWKRKK